MNNDRDWHASGACVGHPDPDLWHYGNTHYADEQLLEAYRSVEAIEVCGTCPVQEPCLKQGLETENIVSSIGGHATIWGGKLASERAVLLGHETSYHVIRDEVRHAGRVGEILGRIAI